MDKPKKPYTTPTIKKVNLVAEEAVLGFCKGELNTIGPATTCWPLPPTCVTPGS